MIRYWVIGGEYQDTSFKEAASGKVLDRIGPFKTIEEAKKEWQRLAWASVDQANFRYHIETEDYPS